MIKVLLLIAAGFCLATAFRVRTEVTQEDVCQYPGTFSSSTSTPAGADPVTGAPTSNAVISIWSFAQQVIGHCRPPSGSGTGIRKTNLGTVITSDYGREQIFLYQPDPTKTSAEWMINLNNYNPMSGWISVGSAREFYFDLEGKASTSHPFTRY